MALLTRRRIDSLFLTGWIAVVILSFAVTIVTAKLAVMSQPLGVLLLWAWVRWNLPQTGVETSRLQIVPAHGFVFLWFIAIIIGICVVNIEVALGLFFVWAVGHYWILRVIHRKIKLRLANVGESESSKIDHDPTQHSV
ncbi:MAG: hypothetical protein ACRCZF_11110 [Gemmataceae bacterium]